jgi:hypothetical protein
MDYNKHYMLLVQKAKKQNRKRNTGTYYEQHHIVPKSEGGTGTVENLVFLTAREHFIAHWLLYRADTSIMSRAHSFWRMCRGRGKVLPENWLTVSSRAYEEARLAHSKAISRELKGQKKSTEHVAKVAAANKGKKRNAEAKKKMSEAAKKRGIPEGFYLMREAAITANKKPVLKLDPNTTEVLNRYDSLKQAAESVNVSISNISIAIKKNTKSGNYKWKFKQ